MEKGNNEVTEREITRRNGFVMVLVALAVGIVGTLCLVLCSMCNNIFSTHKEVFTALFGTAGGLLVVVFCGMCAGFHVLNPNESMILTLFGRYYGTIKREGFYYTNPFARPVKNKKISLKTMTLNNQLQKVNDEQGNPIIIGAVVIWRVVNPTNALLCVDNYKDFLSIQCDSTIRNIARMYPYDMLEEDGEGEHEKTLRGSSQEIADSMKQELSKRVEDAGILVQEVRITHLSYAEEIAVAMLQRQQAAAIIAARKKIVEGAVGMVDMAIQQLEKEEVVSLDDERKAAMVSNLLVVLCGHQEAQPIVNSGSIY